MSRCSCRGGTRFRACYDPEKKGFIGTMKFWSRCVPTGRLVLLLAGTSLLGSSSATAQQASQGKFDGPAELPRVYVKSSASDTPSPGKVRTVKATDNLQDALDDAACGDTLKL